MADFRLNPMPILDETAFGGFRAGMADQRGLMHSDSDLASEALDRETKQHALDKNRLNSPLEAIERANKYAAQEQEQLDWQSGRRKELMDAENAAKLQEAIAKKSDAEVKDMYNQATGMASASSLFNEDDYNNPQNPNVMAKWDKAVEIADRVGMKNFPRQYSPDNLQKLRMGGKIAMSTIPYLQKRELVAVDQAHDSNMLGRKLTSAEGIAAGHDRATVTASENRSAAAAAARDLETRLASKPDALVFSRISKLKEEGKPIPLELIQQYISLSKQADIRAAVGPLAKELTTLFRANPSKKKELAKEYGLDASINEVTLANEVALKKATEDALKIEYPSFQGDRIQFPDGRLGTMRDGKPVPDKGPAPKKAEVKPAPAASKVVASSPPSTTPPASNVELPYVANSTADMINRPDLMPQDTPAPAKAGPVKASNKAEYDALKDGQEYISPDGKIRVKGKRS